MARPMRNPFQPGPGLSPPLRAGHERAAAFLAEGRESIRDKGSGNIVVLCGPRGSGKTALLGELRDAASTACVRVIAPRLGEIADGLVTLPQLLAVEAAGARPRVMGTGGGPRDAGARAAPGHPGEISAGNALRRHLGRPLLLMVDGAHERSVDLGRSLLLATQRCIKQGLPLLVVLVGTPGLPVHLRRMRVDFVGRCRRMRIGRSPAA